MSGIYAVIPVKLLRDSKSRLSSILDPEKRETLTLLMLEDVVNTIQSSRLIEKILVVTPDEKVIQLTRRLDVDSLASNFNDLNRDLETGLAWCQKNGAKSILIVLADLPAITGGDLKHIIGLTYDVPNAVIAPSRDDGTNVLLLHPCDLISPSFGLESYERHMLKLKSVGVEVKVYQSNGTALDIDTPKDVLEFSRKKSYFFHHLKSWNYLHTIISEG
jgi:2-phospho-L-lactate guanylyltransferase